MHMIKNEKQYKITRNLLVNWQENHRLLLSKPIPNTPAWIYKEQLRTVEEEISQLKKQLKEYEETKSGKRKLPNLLLLEEIPNLLVKWRLARNLTQKALAKKLGMHENQLQRYENTNYAGASLSTVLQIARVLRSDNAKKSA
jgi:ribosome-binding protein aMBF1 (putative translation factor)